MKRMRSMMWPALVMGLALLGSGVAVGGPAAASQGAAVRTHMGQQDAQDLLTAVAGAYDPSWEFTYPIEVPSSRDNLRWFSWHEVGGVPGAHALAMRLEDRPEAAMPARLLVRVWGSGPQALGDYGLLVALVDGDNRQVKASAPLEADSQFLRWTGVEPGDALLLVDPSGQFATSQETTVGIAAQDDEAPFPTLQVGAPAVEQSLLASSHSLLGYGHRVWFRVADSFRARWAVGRPGPRRRRAGRRATGGLVFEPDGSVASTHRAEGAAPGDPPRSCGERSPAS